MITHKIKSELKKLPHSPGIYKFFDKDNKLIYVGKSVSIKKRVTSYFSKVSLGPKTDLLVKKINRIEFIKVFSEFEALLLEAELIRTNQPFFNSIAKDDKSPIYIKITKADIPLISLERKRNITKDKAFVKGPFPSAKETREILRMIRKIFPYCHHKNPQKPCLYVHLGLCSYPYQSQQAAETYQKTIQKIKKLLSGRIRNLESELTREMTSLAKNQQYEQASVIKKQIEKLQHLTTTYFLPPEFLERPTLVDDLTLAKLKDLQSALSLPKLPKRIECYDISNIQGNLATGAMSVFTNGQPDKGEYRKFKIKFTKKPNDYEMLKEIISRRSKNNWPKPDLMIIDGGRGQLNAVLSAISKHSLNTYVISLAKRFEEIYTQNRVLPISLPKESPARQLAQAIRDEAHRFAITYHRLLRSKKLLES